MNRRCLNVLLCALLLGTSLPARAEGFTPITEVIPADTAYAVIWRSYAGPSEAGVHQKSPPLQALEYLGATLIELTTGVDDFSNFGVDLAGDMAVFASGTSPVWAVSLSEQKTFATRMHAIAQTADEATTEGDITTLRFPTLTVSYAIQPRGWTRYAFVMFHDGTSDLTALLDHVAATERSLSRSPHLASVLAALPAEPDVLGLLNTASLNAARMQEARANTSARWDTPLTPSAQALEHAKAKRDAWLELCETHGAILSDAVPVVAIGEARQPQHITLDLVAPISLEGRILAKNLLPALTLKGTHKLFADSDFGIAFQLNLSALSLLPALDATALSTCPNLASVAGFLGALRDRVGTTDAADIFTGPVVIGINSKNLSSWSNIQALVVRLETEQPDAAMKGFGVLLRALGYNKKSSWGGASSDAKEYSLPRHAYAESTVTTFLLPFIEYLSVTHHGDHVILAGGNKEPDIEAVATALTDEDEVSLDAFASLRLNGNNVFERITKAVALYNVGDRLTEGARVTFVDRLTSIESLTLKAAITTTGLWIHTEIVQAPEATP